MEILAREGQVDCLFVSDAGELRERLPCGADKDIAVGAEPRLVARAEVSVGIWGDFAASMCAHEEEGAPSVFRFVGLCDVVDGHRRFVGGDINEVGVRGGKLFQWDQRSSLIGGGLDEGLVLLAGAAACGHTRAHAGGSDQKSTSREVRRRHKDSKKALSAARSIAGSC